MLRSDSSSGHASARPFQAVVLAWPRQAKRIEGTVAVLEHSGTASVTPKVTRLGDARLGRCWVVRKTTHFIGPLVPSNFMDCFTQSKFLGASGQVQVSRGLLPGEAPQVMKSHQDLCGVLSGERAGGSLLPGTLPFRSLFVDRFCESNSTSLIFPR